MQRSTSTLNNLRKRNKYSNIKSKLYKKNDNKSYILPYKNVSFISDYERAHWANIKDRAGIIENDSPYIDKQSK